MSRVLAALASHVAPCALPAPPRRPPPLDLLRRRGVQATPRHPRHPPARFPRIYEAYYRGSVIKCRDGSGKFTRDQLNDDFCNGTDGTDEPAMGTGVDAPAVVNYLDAASEIAAELQGTPDFIIGNYSDGNLVASLLSYKMGITRVMDDGLKQADGTWHGLMLLFRAPISRLLDQARNLDFWLPNT